MLRKLNCFLNIVIGSFIGVFIGFGIYEFWHFKTYPNSYVMQSAPCYIYNEDEIDELILLIRDSFMLAFTVLKDTLVKKLEEAESDWM